MSDREGIMQQTVITLDADAAPATFNPLSCRAEPGGVEWLVDFMSELAGVPLTDTKKSTLRTLIEGLPAGASLASLISAVKASEARELGISLDQYDALAPLFEALSHYGQK
ncbi:hypothetical protein Xmlh_13105 [Xanthomonas axonopodis pv. melhusii]|uniref:Uncharacterized protein n=2 Tax=Xanthomonas axonopodis TaxID=53413 RepID=A0A1T1NZU2_9XANT|nr:hypothetical protein [Salmonella enterica]OOW68673.1 hypothetical protein Xmlh_13105 [Xanthomonas axonopodis pv. melhusii]